MLRSAFRSAVSRLSSEVDRVVYETALNRSSSSRKRSRAEGLGHAERMDALEKIRAMYAPLAGDACFVDPAPIAPITTKVRAFGRRGDVVDLAWPSAFEPHVEEVRERFARHVANRTARARAFLHHEPPRGAILLLHGYLGGHFPFEERFWPIPWFYRRGFDVALVALPFHGLRSGGTLRPAFPSSDPRVTIEAFRQAIGDLRGLVGWFAERGTPNVGAMGMSLGGYTTALLATAEPRLAFAIPLVPLASIADFAREGGRLVGTEREQALQHEALEAAYAVVSPLARPAKIPADRIAVLAGEADRITPLSHARRLAEHFGCRLEVFHGGHLVQAGRADAMRAILPMLTTALER